MRVVCISIVIALIGCRSDEGIQKFNSTPEANITSHSSGDSETEGLVVTFVGMGSDSNHGIGELYATWYSGPEVICAESPLAEDGTTTCEHQMTTADTDITLIVKDPENSSGEANVSLVVTPADAPTAEIQSPVASGKFYADQLITFEGLVGDTEDEVDQLLVTWNSNLDGDLAIANEPTGSGELVGAEYLTEGEHFIVLTVEDTTGKEGTDNVTITVGPPNANPLCEITSPASNTAGSLGESVSFVATASDVDIPSDMLSVTWSSDKDGELGASTPSSDGEVLFSFADLSVNTHTITMTVTDEIGATCTDLISYTVGTGPVVTIDTPTDGDIFSEGEPIGFLATISDGQDQSSDISLDWTVNGSSFSNQSATSSGIAEFTDATLAYGSYNLVVTATDTDGLTDSAQVNFIVNGLPTAPLLSVNPDPPSTLEDLNVNIATDAVDPEGSVVSYTYQWLLGGAVQSAYTSSFVPSSATSKNQQWTVRVTPNDGIADGAVGEASVVIQNTSPVLSTPAITPAVNIYTDTNLTCITSVTDPDETLTPSYQWLIGTTVAGIDPTLDLTTTGVMPTDTVVCSVTVTDSDGETATASTSATVENRSPSVASVSISPSSGVTTATSLTCTASVTDDDGETPTVNYTWTVGTDTYSGDTLDLNNVIVTPASTVICTVTAEDGYGASSSDFASITVENTLPLVTANISSSGGGNTAELTCTATASDIDDAPVDPVVSVEWFDGNGFSLGATNPLQLDETMGVDGDDISCVATATDLSGGTASDTVVHTITNTPPVVDSVVLSPNPPDVNTTMIACTPTASDADGDMVTFAYVWLVDGVSQSETTSEFGGPFVVGANVTCLVTPNDGKQDGASEQAFVSVANTLPVVDSINVTPTTVYTSDTLTAVAVFSDADSTQSVSGVYAWHVIDFDTGTDTEVQSGSDNTLSGVSHFDRDDEVYVVVTPTDGTDDGVSVTSGSVTVANTAPTVPSVSISPDPAIVLQDDLVCAVETPSTDEDGDPVVYTYTWTDPGGVVRQTTTGTSALTDGFSATSTSIGDWTCDVIPSDGTDDGLTTTASGSVKGGCYSLQFDGSTDGVNLDAGVTTLLDGLPAFTAEAWVYNFGPGYNYRNILRIGDGGSRGLMFRIGASSVSDPTMNRVEVLLATTDNTSLHLTTSAIETNQWVHLATVYDGSDLRIFVNGEEQASSSLTGTIQMGSTEAYLGWSANHPSEDFNGYLHNVRISSVARYTTSFTPEVVGVDPDTISLWNLYENVGATVFDETSNSNDGTLSGLNWVAQCPQEDADGDGFSVWEDCDDGDPDITTGVTGAAANCAAQSCLTILDAGYSIGSGLYWLDPDGSAAFQAYCDMQSTGGGWTRVARLDGNTAGYCGGAPSSSYDLTLSPTQGAGKIPDSIVQALTSSSPYNEIMYYTGQGGRAEFLHTTMNDPYDTTQAYSGYCTWTCADGGTDSTTCGSEYIGCGFSGRGSGGNNKKLYIGATGGGHAYSLHSGGGFCGLDNRAKYTADVYVR